MAGNAADLVALQGEEHFARRFAAQHMVVALVHGLEEVGVGRLFVRGGERFFRKLAVLAREADQLALIDADAEEIRCFHGHFVAAAAELAADADDAISHSMNLPPLFYCFSALSAGWGIENARSAGVMTAESDTGASERMRCSAPLHEMLTDWSSPWLAHADGNASGEKDHSCA